MAKSALSARNHILRALGKWPQDIIRPQVQFQDVLRKRFESKATSGGPSDLAELRQANALYSLLENRYKKKVSNDADITNATCKSDLLTWKSLQYPITGTLLQPKSNPTYFHDLVKELEEAPNRSWLDRFMLRVKGVVRLK
ncbi:uncharacterized protein PG998_006488 [Apiospora kogelbergensis]|uniref:Complex 1 LYR protein n=1 Tax=Apiospora kogelbergensis TaxID=1337665 RepID=A0AAW0R5H7_9PEZI